MRKFKNIIEDIKYMVLNQKDFGFSVQNLKADLTYMVENYRR